MFHITYDYKKDQINRGKHGLSFEEVYEFDFGGCVTVADERRDYGEMRYNAMGMYKDRLHTLSFTYRDQVIRVISFRAASDKERKKYAKEKEI